MPFLLVGGTGCGKSTILSMYQQSFASNPSAAAAVKRLALSSNAKTGPCSDSSLVMYDMRASNYFHGIVSPRIRVLHSFDVHEWAYPFC